MCEPRRRMEFRPEVYLLMEGRILNMPSKGPNDVRESVDQEKEKDVIRIKSINGISDGYDSAKNPLIFWIS